MKKLITLSLVLILGASFCFADVTVKEKSKVKMHGTVGVLINAFTSAGNEIKTKTIVKGNYLRSERKNEITITDLENERIINIYPKRKEYSVVTFAEMKQQMEAVGEQVKSSGEEQPETVAPEKPQKELEVLFDVNPTGRSKKFHGIQAKQLIMTVTIKQKGYALEDSGGMVITADQWMASNVDGYDEYRQFQEKMMQKMDLPLSMKNMATGIMSIIDQYPQVKEGMDKLREETDQAKEVAVKSTTTIEIVKSKKQMTTDKGNESGTTDITNVSKMLGGFAKKLAKKKKAAGNRSKLMDIFTEIENVSTKPVDTSLFEIPKGFKKIDNFNPNN
ncbi:MAG TPA: hypothetical protein ENH29_04590 [Bacteroidetes bacterium]|nr:hypothetical protein [Bacteroidota bacterium]